MNVFKLLREWEIIYSSKYDSLTIATFPVFFLISIMILISELTQAFSGLLEN